MDLQAVFFWMDRRRLGASSTAYRCMDFHGRGWNRMEAREGGREEVGRGAGSSQDLWASVVRTALCRELD